MHSESTRLSIAMLREVLAGGTYDAVAAAHGLTRTAVEHRVKSMAKTLQRKVGIEGLKLEATGYVTKLREAVEGVEAALARFEAGDVKPDDPPKILTDKEVSVMIHRAGLHSPTPLRDRALIHIVLATAARPLEVARLEIADYLYPDGMVRSQSEMRAAASVNRRERPLFFQNSAAVKAIDAYLGTRRASKGQGGGVDAPYRGFDPNDRLFLNEDGEPYWIDADRQMGRRRNLCRQILDTYRKIFDRVDIHGLSARVLRHNVAVRLHARGATEEQIGLILGIAERHKVRSMLPKRPEMLQLMTDLYSHEDLVGTNDGFLGGLIIQGLDGRELAT